MRRSLSLWLLLLVGCTESRHFSPLQERNAAASASNVDATALRAHVEGLVAARLQDSPQLVSWYPNHPFTQVRSADYVTSVLRDRLQLSPVVEESQQDGVTARNIYVDFVGAALPDEMVILSAHHDAWFTGADDNASGIAVLLEAARIFKDARLDRTVRIIAFDAEEFGLIGSNRFMQSHGADGIAAVVNLDAIAYASHAVGSQKAPPGLSLRDIGDFIAVLANAPAATQLTQVAHLSNRLPSPVEMLGLATPDDAHYPGLVDFLRSDHAPFWRHGVPALFFTDTASFRNANYHTAGDTVDTLDYDFFARVTQLIVGTVHALATQT